MTADLSPALGILRGALPGLAGTYLFGSAADGSARADSDVDLAVYAGPPIDRARLLDLQEALAKALSRDVDLIDLAAASTILQVQAIGEGRLVDAPDPQAAALFELRVMRDYQELKARRADHEADILRTGRVYAG
ncbi:MAG: nucleotidyltransferase domain-containing protein [Hyphomonadaceae bacterium]|nr:nucleotidyltransferase domain-containing protein [Hyphomonadaceae bacterium]GIK47485.1 MAG: toxin-antitoxin system antidote Mnt family protein [Alphaproteobacteria bacterium]